MKRDMNLVREILLQIENSTNPTIRNIRTPKGNSSDEVYYHLDLLNDAGLIEARFVKSFSGKSLRSVRLTWNGHEFLEAIRPDRVWKQVMERLKEFGDSAPIEIIKDLAVEAAKHYLSGLH